MIDKDMNDEEEYAKSILHNIGDIYQGKWFKYVLFSIV